ncbi:MAG TPA: hypothetical protein VFP98_05935 [Candidatus Polarisedimenticolia bacterium]|nr:hypothetical protein [Candidatus Polarisedimenticolia bacterium]
MRKFVSRASTVAVTLMSLTGYALAAKEVQKKVRIPAEFVASIQATGCSTSPGPQIAVQSELNPAGLKAEVIFTHPGGQGPTQETFLVEQVVIPGNTPIPLPPQSVVAGLGNNPYIWLQLTDANGRPMTSEIFLGQCSQAPFNQSVMLEIPVDTHVELAASDCGSAAGPLVAVDGTSELQAVNGKLIFRNTSTLQGGPRNAGEVNLDLVMLPAGQSYPFPQQAVQGQISPDPRISLQLRDGTGQPLGNEISFGRCVALSN